MVADAIARKGKGKQYGIVLHDRNKEVNILSLHESLANKTYQTSAYSTFTIMEKKEREISRLPYYPDRIVHHAIMLIMEPIFVACFTTDTYSCIKGKGIKAAADALKESLKDVPGTTYCLKLDIKKFYPNIDHRILKKQLRRKIKDQDLIWLLDGIIDSAPGVPIGNYLSQYFANFYLTYFDHWVKEIKGVKYYFRYADDIVVLSGSKEFLHQLLVDFKEYLWNNLKLQVKDNWQVFPVEARGIDFIGYVFYHYFTLIRKSIKQNFARKVAKGINQASAASYEGWCKWADCKNLLKKLRA